MSLAKNLSKENIEQIMNWVYEFQLYDIKKNIERKNTINFWKDITPPVWKKNWYYLRFKKIKWIGKVSDHVLDLTKYQLNTDDEIDWSFHSDLLTVKMMLTQQYEKKKILLSKLPKFL